MTPRQPDWDDVEREALEPLSDELAAVADRHCHDPPLDVLRAARAEALPDALQERTIEHLDSSAWSRALVEGTDEADASLDAASMERLLVRVKKDMKSGPAPERRRYWMWAPALALASVALVAIAIVLWRDRTPPAVARRETVQPTVQSPKQPAQPAFRLPLDKPDVRLTPLALVLRGEGSTGRFADDVAPGLNAYRAGEYETAARDLEALRPRYPKSVEIMFYLGISRLFLDDAAAAVPALESARALNDDAFNDDVAWYLAVAYERIGAPDRSRALLDGLCGGKGPFAARACSAAANFR